MLRYSDDEIAHLLNDLESDLVERKQSFRGDTPKKARQAVCAFANDLPNHNQPGVLFIGVDDDGGLSHEPITDYRNPNIADVLKTYGYIQAFGRGIPVANRALTVNGNRPLQFEVNQSYVLCTIWSRR